MSGGEQPFDRTRAEIDRLVREAKARLLHEEGAVTVEEFAERRGVTVSAAHKWLQRQQAAGELVTVEHEGRQLVPLFQLNDTFDLDPLVGEITCRLTTAGLSPWAAWRWWCVDNGWIGEPPVDAVARRDREAVLRAADGLLRA